MSVGIERLAAYVPSPTLALPDLARARDVPAEKLTDGLGVREMAILPPCEVVTMSLWFCVASLLERHGRTLARHRLGLFSYGSGCCAEFFTGAVPADAADALDAGIGALLAGRTTIDVAEYERLAGAGGGELPPGFAGEFVFHGVRQDRRRYGRTGAALAA